MSKKYFEELSISVEQNFDINKDLGLGFQRVGQTDVIWMPVE